MRSAQSSWQLPVLAGHSGRPERVVIVGGGRLVPVECDIQGDLVRLPPVERVPAAVHAKLGILKAARLTAPDDWAG